MFSRNQIRLMDFNGAATNFKFQSFDSDEPEFNEMLDYIFHAAENFGLCELHYREAFRKKELKEIPDSFKDLVEKSKKHNDIGLKSLDKALKIVPKLEKYIGKEVKYEKEKVTEIMDGIVEFFSEMEIKPSDVAKVRRVIEEVSEEAFKGGQKAVISSIEKNLRTLAKVRSSENRGAVENIPIWKIALIAALIGVAFWWVFRCLIRRRRCSRVESNALIATGIVLGNLVIKFC